MSYDLYLFPREISAAADFENYFTGRRNYEVRGDGRTAHYHNPVTGVYFTFSYLPAASADDLAREIAKSANLANDPDWRAHRTRASIHFNMSYFRPHVFGVEAVSEVEALVTAFQCDVQDDQVDGMGTGPFTREGFVRAWNAGNRFDYSVFAAHGEPPAGPEDLMAVAARQGLMVVSSQRIADVWSWNVGQEQIQKMLAGKGLDIFVPRIMWGREIASRTKDAITFVVWGGGVPTVIPGEASHVLVGTPGKPPGLLARFGIGRRRVVPRYLLVDRVRLLGVAPTERVSIKRRELTYCTMGADAFDDAFYEVLGKGWPAANPKSLVDMVPPDGVLDEDIFETVFEAT